MSVINFEKKIIFVHIPKTAGTSMETVFGGKGHADIVDLLKFAEINLNIDTSVYFKFAFVRNPIERIFSLYAHSDGCESGKFNALLQDNNEFLKTVRSQYSYLHNSEGELLVDFVGRYENLENDWEFICDKIGEYNPLPHIYTGGTKIKKPYIQYLDLSSEKIIRTKFKLDFERFEYV